MLRKVLPLALLAALSCAKPDVAAGLDENTCDGGPCDAPGVIQGSLVYSGVARGDAILFLFDMRSLPPPDGNGQSAAAIARIPAAELFDHAAPGSIGPFSAPFVFTQVPSNHAYQVRAFLDVTGEFDPFFDYTQQPRAGDPVGGYGALVNGQPQLLSIAVAPGQVVTSANVALTQVLRNDPPSFVITADSPTTLSQSMDRPQVIRLQTQNLGVPSASFASAQFAVELAQAPGPDGRAIVSDGDGLADVYPKVILRQLDQLNPDGTRSPVAAASAAVIPAKTLPMPYLPAIVPAAPGGAVPDALNTSTISVLVEPFAVKLLPTPAGERQRFAPLPEIPLGHYQIVVIEKTGQVWTMPNSLGTRVASQGVAIDVAKTPVADGALSGKIRYSGSVKTGNIVVQAYRDDPSNPPPPLGGQLPVRVLAIPAGSVTQDGSGFTVAYRIGGLAPGHYIVEALDDAAGTFSPVDILQTPTRGDLLGAALDSTGNPASVEVTHGETAGVDVTMGPGLASDPPSFELDPSVGSAAISADARAPVRFGVIAKPVDFPAGPGASATPAFTVSLVRDAGGKAVDRDGDGLLDVWPRAFLVQLDPTDASGLRQSSPPVIIPAAVDPTPFMAALKPQPLDPVNNPAPVTLIANKLSIVARPVALDVTDTAHPVRQIGVPPGRYQIVLINQTGQVWQIPNSSGTSALAPAAAALANTAAQSKAFVVGPPAGQVFGGEIDGTLTVSTGAAFAGAYIFAYSAANPPPGACLATSGAPVCPEPAGAVLPVSSDYHSFAEFDGSSGAKTVAYALRDLPAGKYLVTALIDTRGDFAADPLLYAAAPGAGTVLGGYANGGSIDLLSVDVGSTAVTGIAAAAPFFAGQPALPPRPSFQVVDLAGAALAGDVPGLTSSSTGPIRFNLQARAMIGPELSPSPETSTAFPVSWVACSSGKPLDLDGDNLPDLYPQVRLVLLGADGLNPARDSEGAVTIIPAAVDPEPYLGGNLTCSGTGSRVAAQGLGVAVAPAAFKVSPNGARAQLAGIPAGRYQIVVISSTGQIWRIPNELAPSHQNAAVGTLPSGLAAQLATQGVAVAVAPSGATAAGSISGSLRLSGSYTANSVGNVLVSAWSVSDPPPALAQPGCFAPACGTGRPVSSRIIPRSFVQGLVGQAGASIPYTLPGLPAGNYYLAAMMDVPEQFSPTLSFLLSPPLGAQAFLLSSGSAPAQIAVGGGGSTPAQNDVIFDSAQAAAQTLPVERPIFELAPSPAPLLPSGAAAPVALSLRVPATLPTLTYSPGAAAFHPFPVRDAAGTLLHQGGNSAAPYLVSTQIAFLPVDPESTTQPCAPIALVDMSTGSTGTPGNGALCAQLYGAATGGGTTATACSAGGGVAAGPFTVSLTQLNVLVMDHLCVRNGAVQAQRPSSGRWRVVVVEGLTNQTWSVPNESGFATPGSGQGGFFTVQ